MSDFPTDQATNKRPASNANHQKQPCFFSTKKKGMCLKHGQNHRRMKGIPVTYDTLDNVEILHCGVCFNMDTSDMIKWIQCSVCKIWVHKSCVDPSDDDFICSSCTC